MEIKKYENSLIAFDFDNEMVCATDILKSFPGKKINNFLRQSDTKAFIEVLRKKFSETPKSASLENQILIVNKGGDSDRQGTWMCKLLAYKFAAWLDPEFEYFVYSIFDSYIKSRLEWQQRQIENHEDEIYQFLEKEGLI